MKNILPRNWPMGVWVILCLAGLIMSSYAWIVSSPTGGSPDDDFHQASIWCPTPADQHCVVLPGEGDHPPILVPQSVAQSDCYRFLAGKSAACQLHLSDRLMIPVTRYDNGMYPGYYYDFMHMFVENDVDRAILVMRWVNVGLATLLYGAIFFLASPSGRRLTAYTLLGTAVPLVTFFSTSINPSAWAILGVVSAWLGFHLGLSPTSKPRRIALLSLGVVGAVLAAAARSDSGAYLVIICAAVLVYHWPTVIHRIRLVTPFVVASILGVLSFLSSNQADAATGGMNFTGRQQIGSIKLFVMNVFQLPEYVTGYWNFYMGWLDTKVPWTTTICATAVAFGLCVWGISQAKMNFRHWLSIIGLFLAILGVPLLIVQASHTFVSYSGMQARYIAPLIIVFVGACLADRNQPSRSLPLATTVAFVVLTSVANMYALYTLIQRYVTGARLTGLSLSAGAQWWRGGGPSPMWTWVMGSVGFALMTTILFAVRRPSVPEPALTTIDEYGSMSTSDPLTTGTQQK